MRVDGGGIKKKRREEEMEENNKEGKKYRSVYSLIHPKLIDIISSW